MTASRPLVRTTLSVQIAEELRRGIQDGVYAPGVQLNEAELALSFGVSRGPLREAIQRLVQEELLRSEPHRGVFVIEMAEDDVLDIFFVRETLEASALSRITDRRDRATTSAALMAIADRMDKAMRSGDRTTGGELDFEFHKTLVDAAGSDRLSRTYTTVQAETRLCLHRLMDGYRSSVDLAVEHRRLAYMVAEAPIDALLKELKAHLGDPSEILRRARGSDDGAQST